MHVVIENGWWLAGAAVLAVGAAVLWAFCRRRSRRWRMACAGLPGLAAVLVALALAGLVLEWSPAAKRVVVLLDLSGSTRGMAWRDPAWVRELARRRLASNVRLTVVGFGGRALPRELLSDVAVGDGRGESDRWPADWGRGWGSGGGGTEAMAGGDATGAGSDVGAALDWRRAEETRGGGGKDENVGGLAPRWVITDGLVEGARGVANRGIAVGWTQMAAKAVDVGVVELATQAVAPAEGGGSGVEVLARIATTGKTEASMTVLRDGKVIWRQGGEGKAGIAFAQAGSRWISVRDVLAPGEEKLRHHYEVVVERAGGGDPWPENDRGTIAWTPQEARAKVLVVGTMEELAGIGGLDVGVTEAGGFSGLSGRLAAEGWQVIVLNDVPLAVGGGRGLPESGAAVLSEFVRETGGGLLIVGRAHAFGAGRYAEGGTGPGTLEGLSPVASAEEHRPAANFVFVLDASGSMNEAAGQGTPDRKFSLAARGVESALQLLKDEDHVTVITFNDRAEVLAQGTKAELLQEVGGGGGGGGGGQTVLRQRLDAVQPTGNTVPDAALAEVARALGKKSAEGKETKMVVLLTDGEIPRMEVAGWKKMLADAGAGLAIVAPAGHGGTALETLAKEVKALWLATEDAGNWPLLLHRAVGERMSGHAETGAVSWGSTGTVGADLHGTAKAWIRVWKKDEAQEVAVAEGPEAGKVLGATVQRGLGKVAAVAMGAGDSPETYGELLRRLVKEVTPAAGDRRFTVAARREAGGEGGDEWLVTADGIEGGRFLDGEQLQVRVISGSDGGGSEETAQLPQTGPGHYEARVPGAAGLTAVVVRAGKEGEELVGRVHAGAVAGSEWPASYGGAAAESPAGAVAVPAEGAGKWRPRLEGYRMDLSRWLWMAGALAALGALWVRRGPGGGR